MPPAIELGLQERLYLGNLDAVRDWGHARDYVEGMWMIVQQDKPDDYVLATGERHSVREFVERAFACVNRNIEWRGSGVKEKGIDARSDQVLVEVDPRYFRPTEVDLLLGDPSKARQRLGWRHKTSFNAMVKEMVTADLVAVAREKERPAMTEWRREAGTRGYEPKFPTAWSSSTRTAAARGCAYESGTRRRVRPPEAKTNGAIESGQPPTRIRELPIDRGLVALRKCAG